VSPSPRRERPAPGAGLVVRRRDGAVLLGTRTSRARSWPGTLAFPGGAVDAEDIDVPLLCGAADVVERAARAAALREALEEAGLLLVCGKDGAPAAPGVVDDAVEALRAGGALGTALRARGLCLDDRGLVVLSAWRTAEGSFEVLRFLLCVEHDAPRTAPLVDELADVAFVSPRAALAAWHAGRAWLLPPIRDLLHRLADVEDVVVQAPAIAGRRGAAGGPLLVPGDDVLARLRGGVSEAERCRRDLAPGVVVIDARTPTLWPATHTNAVVLGGGDALLVDPATPYDDERDRFDALLHTILDGARDDA